MNEQIRELYKEAIGKEWAYDFDEHYAEKFAELIVRECCSVAKTVLYKETFGVGKRVSWNNGIAEALDTIVEHFGVEE